MNCPFCGKEMETGYLYGPPSTGYFYWLPKDQEPPLPYSYHNIEKRKGFVLYKEHFLSLPKHPTHICRDCGQAIFPLEPIEYI